METVTCDVVIVGAGPTGLACAIELQRAGFDCVVLDKGCIVNSLYHFPTQMVYFTTPELLEIGGYPLVCLGEKPTRLEALKYYRRVVESESLNVRQYERVLSGTPEGEGFVVVSQRVEDEVRRRYECRKLVVATGYYDNPNRLGIPGEELPKVAHYFSEAHPFHGRDVAVVGAGNSAAEAALDLFRGGARVTLIHRRAELSRSLKYWVAPDIGNRLERGEIQGRLESVVTGIRVGSIGVRHLPTGREEELPNDYVFALIGYHADFDFLRSFGIEFDPESLKPQLDPQTFESNVPGLYMAGVVIAGRENNKVFIENGRFHGGVIASAIARISSPRQPAGSHA